MSGFDDDHIARLIKDDTDALTGPPGSVPPWRAVAPVTPIRRRRFDTRWMLPLVAAASVAAIALGTVGISQVVSSHRQEPGTQVPTPTSSNRSTQPPPSALRSASSSSSTSPSPATAKASGTGAAGHTIELGGATVVLPSGWIAVARQTGTQPPTSPSWCLRQQSASPTTPCPIVFTDLTYNTLVSGSMDYDTPGNGQGNASYCTDNATWHYQSGNTSLGGRPTEWRHWDITCLSGKSFHPEQYVVPTEPAYSLFAVTGGAADLVALRSVASRSALPTATKPLRYFDRGYLRSVTPTSTGVHIALDRTAGYDDHQNPVNTNPATYGYDISATVWKAFGASAPYVGELLQIHSNGTVVTLVGPG